MGRLRGFISDYEKSLLVELYSKIPETVDELPYTEAFENLYREFHDNRKYPSSSISRSEFWRILLKLRKSGRLPRKKKRKEKK